jgi:hypothetical protein
VLFSSVVINEIMNDPAMVSDNYGEWFELHNTGEESIDLNGWVIRDSGRDSHLLSGKNELILLPGAYYVLGREGDPGLNGGYSPNYVYDNFTLSNGEDEIILVDPIGELIDSVTYGVSGWPQGSGQSLEFIEGSPDNSIGEAWALSTEPFGDGDMGTPGGENSVTSVGIGNVNGDQRAGTGSYFLFQNCPNPFSGSTTISVNRPEFVMDKGFRNTSLQSQMTIKVYNMRGRLVRDLWEGELEKEVTIVWDGKDNRGMSLKSGIYFLRLEGAAISRQRKVVLKGM